MKKKPIAKFVAVAAQCMILITAPGLSRGQSTAPQMVQPSGTPGAQADPYAAAFAGLTYTARQKEAISKIQQDIASRKAAVEKSDQLTQDQKDAMLTGYTHMEYGSIYKELTPEQQKLVSSRLQARRAAERAAEKAQAPAR